MRKSVTRFGVVALAVAAVAGLSTSPASALASAAAGNCGYGQTCAAYAQGVPRVGTGSDVEVSCTAITPYSVQATIVQCYIVGNTGDVHWTDARLTQGQVSTLVYRFDAWSLRSNTYQVCTGAGIFTSSYAAPKNFACGSVV